MQEKLLQVLNIAVERQKIAEDEHAVFLSGNGPLVDVLQEALARDDAKRNNISRKEASRKVKEFIQIIHHLGMTQYLLILLLLKKLQFSMKLNEPGTNKI